MDSRIYEAFFGDDVQEVGIEPDKQTQRYRNRHRYNHIYIASSTMHFSHLNNPLAF